MRKEDLLGQKFGWLTVIAPAPSRNGRTYWTCRCECGKEKVIEACSLKRGLSRSCGCTSEGKHARISGKRFGMLVAVECVGSSSDGNTLWKCKCDCGNETVVQYNNLKSNHTTSCGCKKIDVWKNPDKRVAKLKETPSSGRFETNIHAKNWKLTTPDGTVYQIKNLSLFIRNNPDLFDVDVSNDKEVLKLLKKISEAKTNHRKWNGWTVEEG